MIKRFQSVFPFMFEMLKLVRAHTLEIPGVVDPDADNPFAGNANQPKRTVFR